MTATSALLAVSSNLRIPRLKSRLPTSISVSTLSNPASLNILAIAAASRAGLGSGLTVWYFELPTTSATRLSASARLDARLSHSAAPTVRMMLAGRFGNQLDALRATGPSLSPAAFRRAQKRFRGETPQNYPPYAGRAI